MGLAQSSPAKAAEVLASDNPAARRDAAGAVNTMCVHAAAAGIRRAVIPLAVGVEPRCKEDPSKVASVVSAGITPLLVAMLTSGREEPKYGVQNAAAAVKRICAVPGGRDAAVAAGVPAALAAAMATCNVEARNAAAGAFSNICKNAAHVPAVVRAGAIAPLAAMLASGGETAKGVSSAAAALSGICAVSEGRDAAVAAGVPAALAAAMATGSAKARSNAADAVGNICESGLHVATIVGAGVVPLLAAMLKSGAETSNGVDNVVDALVNICATVAGRDAAVASGVPAALAAVMSTCTAEARSNAAFAFGNICKSEAHVAPVVLAGAVPLLVAMLTSGSEAHNGGQNATFALSGVCAVPMGRDAAVNAGVPEALVTTMKTGDATARSNAALILSTVCGNAAYVPGITSTEAVALLAAMLTSGAETANGVQNATCALLRMCAAPEGRDAAVDAEVPDALRAAMATFNAGARYNADATLALLDKVVEERKLRERNVCAA